MTIERGSTNGPSPVGSFVSREISNGNRYISLGPLAPSTSPPPVDASAYHVPARKGGYTGFTPARELKSAAARELTDEPAGSATATLSDYEESEYNAAMERATVSFEKNEDDDGMYEVNIEELVDDFGLSGMAIFARVSDQTIWELLMISAQAFTIQVTILLYVWSSLIPATQEKQVQDLIVFFAVVLHVVHCLQDIPFCVMVLYHWRDLKAASHHNDTQHAFLETVVCLPIFIMDAFVVPIGTMILGALYLCTSVTAPEVIFNSCAVVFISEVDNYLLSMHAKLTELKGYKMECEVRLPFLPKLANASMWSMVYIPVIPLGLGKLLTCFGHVMQL